MSEITNTCITGVGDINGIIDKTREIVNDENNDKCTDEPVIVEVIQGETIHSYQFPFNPTSYQLPNDFRLTKFAHVNGREMKPDRAELQDLLKVVFEDDKMQMDTSEGEEQPIKVDEMITEQVETIEPVNKGTSITKHPSSGIQLLQTSDILYPLIDHPYLMGKIACNSVLCGIYAMGHTEFVGTSMIIGIPNRMSFAERKIIIPMIIRGYKDAARSVGVEISGCQIIYNPWCIIGGTATSVCTMHEPMFPNDASDGDVIVLTKPLGTMVATVIFHWIMDRPDQCGRLLLSISKEDVKKAFRRAVDTMLRANKVAADLMKKYNVHAACEVSSHGILGHLELLAQQQKRKVNFTIHNMPVIAKMNTMAKMFGKDMPLLQGSMAEVSGGLLVVLPRKQAALYCKDLESEEHRQAWIIGVVLDGDNKARVIDRPRVIQVPAKENASGLW